MGFRTCNTLNWCLMWDNCRSKVVCLFFYLLLSVFHLPIKVNALLHIYASISLFYNFFLSPLSLSRFHLLSDCVVFIYVHLSFLSLFRLFSFLPFFSLFVLQRRDRKALSFCWAQNKQYLFVGISNISAREKIFRTSVNNFGNNKGESGE